MSAFSSWALQKALYTLLSGDGTLAAKVSGIYDRVPAATAYPYVVFREAEAADWSTMTEDGVEHTLTLYIYSREGGHKQTAQIMERLHALLHDASLTVEGASFVLMRMIASAVTLEKDGLTYRGRMQFRILTHG